MEEERVDRDFIIADDGQIAKMQQEYSKYGIGAGFNDSKICEYPVPVYMLDCCYDFCKACKDVISVFSQIDRLFVSRNKKSIDFLISTAEKNRICIAKKANITQDIFVSTQRMPIKQSMYKLLELHNLMSIMLDSLYTYIKSIDMQEVITRHLLMGSVLHGLCI